MKRITFGIRAASLALVLAGCAVSFMVFNRSRPEPAILYVSPDGNDTADGVHTPLRTIGAAAGRIRGGTEIRLAPGIYRESVFIRSSGHPDEPVRITGPQTGTAVISGSEPSSVLLWEQCTADSCPDIPEKSRIDVWRTHIPWDSMPTAIIRMNTDGSVDRLPPARIPDTAWRPGALHDSWLTPAGGSAVPGTLTHEVLRNLPDLTGSRIYVMDGADRCGTYLYPMTVTAHDRKSAEIRTSGPIGADTYGLQENGLSGYTKFYIEDSPGLLDRPGEWYADSADHALYLFPPEPGNPGLLPLEIGRYPTGITIAGSNISLHNITVRDINDRGRIKDGTGAVVFAPENSSRNVRLTDITVHRSGHGIRAEPRSGHSATHVSMKRISVSDTETSAVSFIGPEPKHGILSDIHLTDSKISRSGYPSMAPAVFFERVSESSIRNSAVSFTAGYGIHVTGSHEGDTLTSGISITGNSVSDTCTDMSGCSGIKVFGGPFRSTVISGNSVSDTTGRSYCRHARDNVAGDGIGIFISNASGISVRRNSVTRAGYTGILVFTRQFPATDTVITANTIYGTPIGITLSGNEGGPDTNSAANDTRHDGTVIRTNVVHGANTALFLDPAHPVRVRVSNNILEGNAIAAQLWNTKAMYARDIPELSPGWESGPRILGAVKNILFR